MCRCIAFLVLVVVSFGCLSLLGANKTGEASTPFAGFLHDDYLYVAKHQTKEDEPLRLLRCRLSRMDTDRIVMEHEVGRQANYTTKPYRWRIGHDCLWLASSAIFLGVVMERVPLDDLDIFTAEGIDYKLFYRKYPKRSLDMHKWYLWPLYEAEQNFQYEKGFGIGWARTPVDEMWFDVLPVGQDACRLFILWKRQVTVWEGRGKWLADKVKWDVTWAEQEVIAADLNEQFTVFQQGADYFFVTDSGKAYIAKKREKGPRQAEPIWIDASRPIIGMIADVDRGETFVFAKNKRAVIGAKDCYFALADKPRVVEFSPFDLTPVKAPEPLRTVTQYARLLAVKGSPPK
jgi:hypothetical protein